MFILSPEYWEVKQTKDKGKGVFAKKDIPAGVVIGDYVGKLIRIKEEDAYEANYGLYVMYYNDRASIFPDLKKDGIHLINHSCEPNCFMYSYKGRTLYFALRNIFKDEELTVSYMLSPIDKDCSPCTDACKCGSETCTSTQHVNQSTFDKWRAFDDKRTRDVKLPRVSFGKTLDKLPSYPKNISDHSIYPLFGTSFKPAIRLADKKLPYKKTLRKLIRQTGRQLYFKDLNIKVLGVSDNLAICKPIPA